MQTANSILLLLSLALELALLLRIVSQGMARTHSAFAALLALYFLRSVLIFSVSGHSSAAFGPLYTSFGVLDVLLQVAVAWQLFAPAGRVPGARTPLRLAAVFALLAAGSAAGSLLLAHVVPANPRSPLDRSVLFTAVLLLGVGAASVWSRFTPAARRLLQGFLVLSAANILTQTGRTVAAFDRSTGAFRAWSYAAAAVYLAVLLFWLLTVYPARMAQARAASAIA